MDKSSAIETVFLTLIALGLGFVLFFEWRARFQKRQLRQFRLPILDEDGYDAYPDEVVGPCWNENKPCPAYSDGRKCNGDYADSAKELPPGATGWTCPTFLCPGCGKWQPWCFGGSPDPRCDDCVAKEG